MFLMVVSSIINSEGVSCDEIHCGSSLTATTLTHLNDSLVTRVVAVSGGLFSGLHGGLEGPSLSLATISSSIAGISVLSSKLAREPSYTR